ncbi:hypothetical protein M407DRAFT_28620 [Tulasnella calospora MUT 4182]|uniref:DUF6535 domain-containing protein n=1 Tax=Tulasnella calospora MUT 4182 TaxID=1051891 RepID=A0A0C3LKE4_9AGAM|nr:hypothetical protein M407DRAFT_28620 [Tulasnella calospora MUT 4182]
MNKENHEPKLKHIPKVPDKFGEDGGHFYRYYDNLADELDEDMVTSLKARLDGILLFTGLFAGINTAFLALTLPEMSADPADDTNALLLQLVMGGNGTIRSADDLPSAAFTPSPGVFPVNVLFSLSLTLAVICAFLAVLGQQWLVYYRKRSGGGVEHQRWEQLRRHLGARHWRLEGVLDDILPSLLQLALVIFCVAFVIYLRTLSKKMCYVVAAPMATALAILLFLSVVGFLDKWCPFKSTLSHFMQLLDEIPTKYRPLTYLIAFLVLVPFVLPLFVVTFLVSVIAGLWMGLRFYVDFFHGRAPDWMRNGRGPVDAISREAWRVSTKIVDQLTSSLVPPGKATAFLQAAAVKRILFTSEDHNTLIYTAINIQAMKSTGGAQYLLDDDTVHERMEELIKSPDKALSSAFSCAFSHLLLGGQYAALFVTQEDRHLYRMRSLYPRADQYYEELHPLKRRVGFIFDRLSVSMESPGIRPDGLVESLLYFELLQIILDENSDYQQLLEWLDRVIQKQQSSKVSTPLVISLVADTVNILNTEIESADAPSGLRTLDPEQEGQEGLDRRDRLLTVQQQRVEIVKTLIHTIGWEMQSVPSYSWQGDRTSALGLIKEAFTTKNNQSPRRPDKSYVWLLEQALLISTSNQHERGWEFVAGVSVDLLLLFDNPESPMPDSVGTGDSQKDNRLRCANILSQCLQDMRDHLGPDEFIKTVSPALGKLVDYWARFEDDFNQNPDVNDAAMSSSWLGIRNVLDKPEESGWGPLHNQHFGEAYPSLKHGFDAISSAAPGVETVPEVDRNPLELPRVVDSDKQTGRTEPNKAVAERATPKSDEHDQNPLVDADESQEHDDAQELNLKQRDSRPGQSSGRR